MIDYMVLKMNAHKFYEKKFLSWNIEDMKRNLSYKIPESYENEKYNCLIKMQEILESSFLNSESIIEYVKLNRKAGFKELSEAYMRYLVNDQLPYEDELNLVQQHIRKLESMGMRSENGTITIENKNITPEQYDKYSILIKMKNILENRSADQHIYSEFRRAAGFAIPSELYWNTLFNLPDNVDAEYENRGGWLYRYHDVLVKLVDNQSEDLPQKEVDNSKQEGVTQELMPTSNILEAKEPKVRVVSKKVWNLEHFKKQSKKTLVMLGLTSLFINTTFGMSSLISAEQDLVKARKILAYTQSILNSASYSVQDDGSVSKNVYDINRKLASELETSCGLPVSFDFAKNCWFVDGKTLNQFASDATVKVLEAESKVSKISPTVWGIGLGSLALTGLSFFKKRSTHYKKISKLIAKLAKEKELLDIDKIDQYINALIAEINESMELSLEEKKRLLKKIDNLTKSRQTQSSQIVNLKSRR